MKELAVFFSALADENRLRLLHLMKDGEICVCFLQEILRTNQPKVSRHLAYLKKAGVVEARREGKWMYYRLAKLDVHLKKILSEVFRRMESNPSTKKDTTRLKRIACCPSRYGVSLPV